MSKENPGIRKIGQRIENSDNMGVIDSSLEGQKIPGNTSVNKGNVSVNEKQRDISGADTIILTDKDADAQGFSSSKISDTTIINNEKNINTTSKVGRPAKQIDLASLNESNVLEVPFIQAKSFDVAALLNVKPKDPSIRFRWVNWKNNDGSNYQMFKSAGFQNAEIEDVDQSLTPLGDNLVKNDGIKYFDVILMKINTIRLMEVYKANIIKSLTAVGRFKENALVEARRTFNLDVGEDIINELKKQGKRVEFYSPTKDELDADEKYVQQHGSIRL